MAETYAETRLDNRSLVCTWEFKFLATSRRVDFLCGHRRLGLLPSHVKEKRRLFAETQKEENERKRQRRMEQKKREEQLKREQDELNMLEIIRGKLKEWVQECLVEEERRQKMVDKAWAIRGHLTLFPLPLV